MTKEELAKLVALRYPAPKIEDYNDILEYRNDRNWTTVLRNAVLEGYDLAKKDLLSNAVDAEIVRDIHNLLHIKSAPLPMPSEYHFGDKVKIIILPREYK